MNSSDRIGFYKGHKCRVLFSGLTTRPPVEEQSRSRDLDEPESDDDSTIPF